MHVHIPTIVLVLMLSVAPLAHAEPGKVDTEAAEMVAELIGAPVFSKDGTEVGEVADISFDDELQPDKLRMTTGAMLGLGTRIVQSSERFIHAGTGGRLPGRAS